MSQAFSQAVILGSTRGLRRLDPTQSMPLSLQFVDSSGTVLDWALSAFSNQGVDRITYVGGYQIQKVIEKFPHLDCRYHGGWQREGELAALLYAGPEPTSNCLVCRSSTLIVPQALARLSQTASEVVVGCCQPNGDSEFVGLLALTGPRVGIAFTVASRLAQDNPDASIDGWIDALIAEGFQVSQVDLDGLAAPVNDPVALAGVVFSSKSKTLENIRPLVTRAAILDQVSFNVQRWTNQPEDVLSAVADAFGDVPVVVRSSARAEDGLNQSLAGHFRSVLDVPARDKFQLRNAIDQVIQSYGPASSAGLQREEVFVQPQVNDLAASGVLLTRDPESGAPYFVLNIDRQSGRSDTVTSGSEAPFDTVIVSRRAELTGLPKDVETSLTLAQELEGLTHLDALDIEFGIDHSGRAYLFQVRPIAKRSRKFELADEDLEQELECVRDFLKGQMHPHPHLLGNTTMFSTMSDWNPAEMIGTAPRPLALSLYQRLVGQHSWAQARALIGYFDVTPEPLIVALGGRPYVDVRASLNSFLPQGVEPQTTEIWVEHGLDLLRDNPRLQDKVEFDVALTCLSFDTEEENSRLASAGLSVSEIQEFRQQLLRLTDGIFCGDTASVAQQLATITHLAPRRTKTLARDNSSLTSLARQIHYLIEDCNRYGVVPFSVLARYAFIAMTLLRSLRSVGVFSKDEYETVLRSIPTVATDQSQDLALFASGEITKEAFLDRYGHLRPSSYDITSPNYASAPDLYLTHRAGPSTPRDGVDRHQAAEVFDAHSEAINRLMAGLGFSARCQQLRDFVLDSIPARERAKFEFMKNLDAALEKTAFLGEQLGFDRNEISFLPIYRIESGAVDSPSGAARMQIKREIEFAKKRWNLTCALRLPHLVRSTEDVDAFQLEEWTPNFVSTRRVVAPPMVLDDPARAGSLEGKIVLIRAADPGYDWIFGHPIAGLVTQFGGVASHMAIRAAEFGLPAAIGSGEIIFERLRRANLIELDCANQRLNPV